MKSLRKKILAMASVVALSGLMMASVAQADKLIVKDTGGNNKFVVTDTGLVGVGTATPTGGSLHVVATDTPALSDSLGNTSNAGMGVDISTPASVPPTGPIQAAAFSFLVKYQNGGTAISNNFNTFRMIARTDSTVTDPITGALAAANFQIQHKGTNTASNIIAFVANAQLLGTGNVTSAAVVRAATPSITGTGVITNMYGISIKPQKVTGVTNGYGIYQEGTSDVNYFAGPVQAAGGSANHAICWKADGKTLGYCSAVVAADGTCGTCN